MKKKNSLVRRIARAVLQAVSSLCLLLLHPKHSYKQVSSSICVRIKMYLSRNQNGDANNLNSVTVPTSLRENIKICLQKSLDVP